MAEVQILKMSRKHHEVLDYFLVNPLSSLKEASEALGFTIPWLSVICNSDAFRAEFARRREGIEEIVETDVVAHLRRTAVKGINRIDKLMETCDSLDSTGAVTEKLLAALGYSPKSPQLPSQLQVQTNVVLNGSLPSNLFEQARNGFGSSVASQPRLIEEVKKENVLQETADSIERVANSR